MVFKVVLDDLRKDMSRVNLKSLTIGGQKKIVNLLAHGAGVNTHP